MTNGFVGGVKQQKSPTNQLHQVLEQTFGLIFPLRLMFQSDHFEHKTTLLPTVGKVKTGRCSLLLR
jgi:hypothetical protein